MLRDDFSIFSPKFGETGCTRWTLVIWSGEKRVGNGRDPHINSEDDNKIKDTNGIKMMRRIVIRMKIRMMIRIMSIIV